jgi:MarR family transcriptional regulator, organic hydroperoxide resistance regulator
VELIDEFRYLVLAAQREGNRAMTELLRPHGLTTSQAEVIAVLADEGRPLTVREIGDRLVCEQGSPSRLVRTLVAKNMVAAYGDDLDRRSTRIKLSRAGRRLASDVRVAEDRVHELLLGQIDAREMAQAAALLRSLVADLPAGRALARRTGVRLS